MEAQRVGRLPTQRRLAGVRLALPALLEPQVLVYLLVFLLVINLVLLPVLMLALSSVNLGPIAKEGGATLAFFVQGWTSPTTYLTIINTLIFGLGAALLALLLGAFFAFMVERTDMPLKSFVYVAITLTIAMPEMLYGIAWVLLLSPKIGLFNLLIMGLFGAESGFFTRWAGVGLSGPPIQPYTMAGMIFVEALRGAGVVFLMTVGVFRNMDPSLEEAAAVSGASSRTIVSRVTMRLMLPGLAAAFLYYLTSAFESFAIPLVLGLPGNVYVLTTKIYLLTRSDDQGPASALGIVFILIALATVLFYAHLTRQSQRFSTVTGKGYRPRVMRIGRWRYAAAAFTLFYFVTVVVAPFFILLWASLTGRYYQVPSWDALGKVNLNAYATVLSDSSALNALKNTVILVLTVPTVTMLVAVLISWYVMRSKLHGRRVLDALAFMPHSLPSVIIGIAFIYLFLTVPWRWSALYGTVWIIMLAMVARQLPFGSRTTHAAVLQIHKDLEEAALAGGVSWRKTFRYVVLPLLFPAIVAGWVFVGMHAMKDLTLALMLHTPASRVFSILMWDNWQSGEMGLSSAVGVLLMIAIGFITFVGRSVDQYRARKLASL
jgi:iron(III) transport system permease protein